MNIKQKQIYSLLIYIAVNVFFVFYTVYALNNSEINWRMYGGIVIIPFFVVSLWLFCNFSIKLSSFTSIIFILCYVLHFGQIVVKVFNPDYIFEFDVQRQFSQENYSKSVIFILLYLFFYSIGAIIIKKRTRDNQQIEYKPEKKRVLIWITSVSLLLFLPLQIYFWVNSITIRNTGNYLDTLDQNNGFLDMFARFHIIGICGLLIFLKKRKVASYVVLLSYLIISFFSMLSGGRMYAIAGIIVVVCTFFCIHNISIKIHHVVIAVLLAMIITTFMNAIADTRDYTGDINLEEQLAESWQEQPIFNFVGDMGGTQFTVGLVQRRIDGGYMQFNYGKEYIASWISVLPNFGGEIKEIVDKQNYVIELNYPTLGGSIIGEQYYNFGMLGCLFGMLVGIIIEKMDRYLVFCLEKNYYSRIAVLVAYFYCIILWQRNTFSIIPRYIVYAAIVVWAIKKMSIIKVLKR